MSDAIDLAREVSEYQALLREVRRGEAFERAAGNTVEVWHPPNCTVEQPSNPSLFGRIKTFVKEQS